MSFTDSNFQNILTNVGGMKSEDAITYLRECIETTQGDPRVYVLLAAEFASAEQLDFAEGAYICALNRAPEFALARFQLGLLHFVQHRIAAAFAVWELLKPLGEEHPSQLFSSGIELYAIGKYAEALTTINRGIANNHENLALNQDMQKIIDAIHRDMNAKEQTNETQTETDVSSVFLMSAYHQH